jgi:acyl carrier protein
MTKKELVFQAFASVFEIPVEDVTEDMDQLNVENWDSIMHLTLISELEITLDYSFEPEEIEKIKGLKDILAIVD